MEATKNTKDLSRYLLCDPKDFPYGEEGLKKIIEREQTIRIQHEVDLEDSGKRLKEDGKYSEHTPCRYLVTEMLPLIIEGIKAILNKLEVGSATADKQKIAKLATLPWQQFAAIAFTTSLDSAILRDNKATTLSKIASACETEAKMRHYMEHEEKFYDQIMSQQHKSGKNIEHISDAMTIAMNRKANGRYGDQQEHPEIKWEAWSNQFSVWLAATYLNMVVVQTGMFEVEKDYVTTAQYKRHKPSYNRLVPTAALLEWINTAENKIGMYGGFYLPLPMPPRDWTTTQSGGYWTRFGGQKKLIKNFSKGYQEEMLNYSEQLSQVVFPAINGAQNTAWRINYKVFETMSNLWNAARPVGGLPRRDKLESPLCPACGQVPGADHKCFAKAKEIQKLRQEAEKEAERQKIKYVEAPLSPAEEAEYQKSKGILTAWKMKASKIHLENTRLKSLRLAIHYGLEAAEILLDDERFYYVYQTDFRGRLYPCGQLHPQGTDWMKGILEFADGVELGEHGAKWLAVHISNCYGNDKCSYEDRVAWVHEHEEMILECARHPEDVLAWTEADSPFCFLAGCFEWLQYRQEGTKFKSRLAIALDGSCSGIQHYSAMQRDMVGAIATNVKMVEGATKKEDIYQRVADKTIELMQEDIATEEVGYYASTIIGYKLMDRKVVKRAVMTLPYGSTYTSCHEYVAEELYPRLLEAKVHEEIIKPLSRYCSTKVWQAIPHIVQAAREGMDYLQRLARIVAKEALPVTWTTPTGFIVQQSYYEASAQRLRFATGGSIMLKELVPVWVNGSERSYVTMLSQDRHIDPRKQVSGIAPNFIHSLDSSHLMLSVVASKKAGINDFALIHDSLGTHAGRTEEFSQIIRDCFYDLYANHTPLEDITEHLLGQVSEANSEKAPPMPSIGSLDLKDIKKALYLFA